MTYVVTDECVKCKYTDCVEVCPVDCFYEDELMLAINPDECIDCGVCVDECPVAAISEESPELISWIEINKAIAEKGRVITKIKAPLPEAEQYKTEKNKYEKYILKQKQ